MAHFYVTTPIYDVNDVPHIGHAYTTIVADAVAWWHRMLGDEVFFLTGTDEHGLKVQRAAEANGLTPEEQANRTSQRFREAWELLAISNDDFLRTTEARHSLAVNTLLSTVYKNGYIHLATYEGLYCVSCEAYLAEADLLPGRMCPVHNRPVELLKEDNYFFKLSEFTQQLLDWYASDPDAVGPPSKRNEAVGIIRQGLQDISISRTSIPWGIPVPWDTKHVFYVWYDALVNYTTAIGFAEDRPRFHEWWPSVHHIIGKDILRFHCVYWPALLMAAGEAPPHRIHVHGYLLVGGEKMSKTALNQIAPSDLIPEFGVDGFRYHLLRDQPLGPDGEFSHEGMVARYNADLANNLGNLLARVTTLVVQKCGGISPAPSPNSAMAEAVGTVYGAVADAWERLAPSEALEALWRLIRDANTALEETAPWKLEPGSTLNTVLGDALEVLRVLAVLIFPAMPTAAEEIWHRIGLIDQVGDQRLPIAAEWGHYPGGLHVAKGDPLFPRITA